MRSPFRSLLPAAVASALLLGLFLAAPAAAGKKDREREAAIAELPQRFQSFLTDVEFLITDEELEIFLALSEDYQREAFIKQFWEVRDPFPSTGRNEFREDWEARLEYARSVLGGLADERAKILLLNGPPQARIEVRCPDLWPVEVWYYEKPERVPIDKLLLIFYQRFAGDRFQLWYPQDGFEALLRLGTASGGFQDASSMLMSCIDGDALEAALSFAYRQGKLGYPMLLMRAQAPMEKASGEWSGTFSSYSTTVPAGAETFDAELSVDYPSRRQTRTVVQGTLAIPVDAVGRAELAGARSVNLLLNGEILLGDELFDRFRYKFDFPEAQITGDELPLVFQRFLRPGEYRLLLKVEDLNGERFARVDTTIDVPAVSAAPPPPSDPETAALLAEATAALSRTQATIKILEPMGGMQVGKVRFDTLATDPSIAKVEFGLDGKPVLTKSSPPFSVELDLGHLPRSQTLTAVAYDADDEEVARDEMVLNASSHRFAVRIDQPRPGERFTKSARVVVDVETPEDRTVERLEIYVNEDLVATLFQPPWEQPILLQDPGELAYVRAVAYLPDGNSSEDLVFINAPPGLEQIEVQMVELYTSVEDRNGRPVSGLEAKDFRVLEDGTPQEIRRFERVDDLPFYATVLMDVSASMEEELEEAQAAALSFFQEAITPRDRASLITFNDRPFLAQKFTNELLSLGGSLAGLKAERGTALYDSIVFSLFYNNGIKGQRALLLLSDGADESSKFTFDQTLDFVRRAGVTIYAIGLGLGRGEFDVRRKLTKIAEETGGSSFFVDSAEELTAIYRQIEEELRSQYLIAYQSTNPKADGKFREVEVEVLESGLKAQTIRGYYP